MKEEEGNIHLDPKFQEKKELQAALKTELAKLIADRDLLVNTVKKNLEALYISKVGKNEFELFSLECQAARLRRKIQLIQAFLNHGKEANPLLIEKQLDDEYKEWEIKINEMAAALNAGKARLKVLMPEKESRELQRLYRSLVKLLHPDVNREQDDKDRLLWYQAQNAYLLGDVEELKTIILLLEEPGRENTGKEPAGLIDGNIKFIREKVFSIMEYIRQIRLDFPFTIEDKISDPKWVKDKNDEIIKKQSIEKAKIKELADLIDGLLLAGINGFVPGTFN
jgi:hypothetical protein